MSTKSQCTQNGYMKKTITTSEYAALIAWLISARHQLGWSIRDLAEKIDRPHSFVQRVETFERRLDVYEYTVYCKALSLDPHQGLHLLSDGHS